MSAIKKQKSFTIDNRLFAAKGQRILNFIIDLVLIYILVFVVALSLSLIETLFGVNSFSNRLGRITEFESNIIFFFFFFTYYISLEFFLGQTIAKFITGTVVVLKDGTKPNFFNICIRTICRLIPLDGITFLGNAGSGMHDTFSKTFVVKKTIFKRSFNSHQDFQELGSQMNLD